VVSQLEMVMLCMTTGQEYTVGANSGGGIIAFGLPDPEVK